ncbi:CRISPR-associated endonuclease Cas2 [Desulforhopalus vacuolatus]|uniref:CRISPR-associated endonuclease Cas2 n=1 Tax=Desulforhopalus vacuolatus TaxID=40414 RepID=UPI0019638AA6|nr:CRISPR-associated endonuclease Cas2 [Desulforhopalus vacuolatus]MBM9520561.1 CRISPR-associated endonuclease Cas2 [Desulforhopalus vacuolatus]
MANYFIIYDIADAKRLQKVARILLDYGMRMQQSKFEVELSKAQLRTLQGEIARVIDTEKDGVKYFPLCEKCAAKTEVIGQGMLLEATGEFDII